MTRLGMFGAAQYKLIAMLCKVHMTNNCNHNARGKPSGTHLYTIWNFLKQGFGVLHVRTILGRPRSSPDNDVRPWSFASHQRTRVVGDP
jgi:hypothetical protein